MDRIQSVLDRLEALGLPYELERHPAVYTMEDMEALGIQRRGHVVKNLFLRDGRGKRHFLVVLAGHKTADLRALRGELGCGQLGFASEDRLWRLLGLRKGEVTPLGVLNDAGRAVEVVFDRALIGQTRLGVDPNDNTATVWLSFSDLLKVVKQNGNAIIFVECGTPETGKEQSQVAIRPMRAEDYPAVYRLWSQTKGIGLRTLDDSPEGINRFLNRNPGISQVALEGEALVGAVLCGHDGRRGYLYHCAVSPALQRRGIGRRLVEAALSALRTEGIHKAALVAYGDNEAGNAFWRSVSFGERCDLIYRDKSLTEENR